MAVSGSNSDVRFAGISDEDLYSFAQEQDNENMKKKTDTSVSLFRDFLREVRLVWKNFQELDPAELNMHKASFIVNVKRQEGQDNELTTVRGFVSSIDHYPRLQYDIAKDSVCHSVLVGRCCLIKIV